MNQTGEPWGVRLSEWNAIYEDCELTFAGISRQYDIGYSSVKGWLRGDVIPREKSIQKMEAIMQLLKKTKRIPFHPSYGYATESQIDRLRQSITQHEREQIMTQIEKQTRLQGKVN